MSRYIKWIYRAGNIKQLVSLNTVYLKADWANLIAELLNPLFSIKQNEPNKFPYLYLFLNINRISNVRIVDRKYCKGFFYSWIDINKLIAEGGKCTDYCSVNFNINECYFFAEFLFLNEMSAQIWGRTCQPTHSRLCKTFSQLRAKIQSLL